MDNIGQRNYKTCTDRAMNVNRFGQSVCRLETVVLRGKSNLIVVRMVSHKNFKSGNGNTDDNGPHNFYFWAWNLVK